MRIVLVIASLFSTAAFAADKPPADVAPLAKKFYERVRNGKPLASAETAAFFAFPVAYVGFDLEKNSQTCTPPVETKSLKDHAALLPILEHLAIEADKAAVIALDTPPRTFGTFELFDCSHETSVTLDAKGEKIIAIRLSTQKVY